MEIKNKPSSNSVAVITLIIGTTLALVMPFTLTQNAFIEGLDFTSTGQIGDTIGGIVGPILNFTGLILVYLSFKQQYEANEIQRSSMNSQIISANNSKNFNIIIELINELKNEIQLLTVTIEEKQTYNKFPADDYKKITYEGLFSLDAIINLLKSEVPGQGYIVDRNGINFGHQISYILNIILLITQKIGEFNLEPSDKSILIDKLKILYTSKLKSYLEDLSSSLSEAADRHENNLNVLGDGFLDNLNSNLTKINLKLINQ